jgi:hypothetical protein
MISVCFFCCCFCFSNLLFNTLPLSLLALLENILNVGEFVVVDHENFDVGRLTLIIETSMNQDAKVELTCKGTLALFLRHDNNNTNNDNVDNDEKRISKLVGTFSNGIVSKKEFLLELNGSVLYTNNNNNNESKKNEDDGDDVKKSISLIGSNAVFAFNKLEEIDVDGKTNVNGFFLNNNSKCMI